jgi:murein DD-endopeptidase MepM/ murein hydrolase activator NlpD
MQQVRSIRSLIFLVALAIILILAAEPVYTKLFPLIEPDFSLPISSQDNLYVRQDALGSGEFGARRSGGRRHRGIDILSPVGTPVCAARSGRAQTRFEPGGMGRYVLIHHPDGTLSLYGHLSKIYIKDGQWVWRGRPIAEVGKTGNADSHLIKPHLHFEIRKGKQALDPNEYLNTDKLVYE